MQGYAHQPSRQDEIYFEPCCETLAQFRRSSFPPLRKFSPVSAARWLLVAHPPGLNWAAHTIQRLFEGEEGEKVREDGSYETIGETLGRNVLTCCCCYPSLYSSLYSSLSSYSSLHSTLSPSLKSSSSLFSLLHHVQAGSSCVSYLLLDWSSCLIALL